jgi:hypothetical protein
MPSVLAVLHSSCTHTRIHAYQPQRRTRLLTQLVVILHSTAPHWWNQFFALIHCVRTCGIASRFGHQSLLHLYSSCVFDEQSLCSTTAASNLPYCVSAAAYSTSHSLWCQQLQMSRLLLPLLLLLLLLLLVLVQLQFHCYHIAAAAAAAAAVVCAAVL